MKASPLTELPPDLARPRGYRSHAIANVTVALVMIGILASCVTAWLLSQ